jgi:hypothetical protein
MLKKGGKNMSKDQKARIFKQIAGLEKDQGVAFLTMERLKGIGSVTKDTNKAVYDRMVSLVRDAEDMSIEVAKETGAPPKLYNLANAYTRVSGNPNFFDREGAKNKGAYEKSKKEVNEMSYGKAKGIIENEIGDEEEAVNDILFGRGPTSGYQGGEEDFGGLTPGINDEEPQVRMNPQQRTTAMFKKGMDEIDAAAKEQSGGIKGRVPDRIQLAKTLMNRALSEYMDPKSADREIEKTSIDMDASFEYLNNDEELSKLVKTLESQNSEITNVSDMMDEIDSRDITSNRMSDSEKYYAALMMRNLITQGGQQTAQDFIKGILEKGSRERHQFKAIVRKAKDMSAEYPLVDGEASMSAEELYSDTLTGDKGERMSDVETRDMKRKKSGQIADADATEKIKPEGPAISARRAPKTGDALTDAMYRVIVKGGNNRNMPKGAQGQKDVVDALVSFAKTGKIPERLPYGKNASEIDMMRMMSTEPTIDDLIRFQKFSTDKQRGEYSEEELAAIENTIQRDADSQREKKARRRGGKKPRDTGDGDLSAILGEWAIVWGMFVKPLTEHLSLKFSLLAEATLNRALLLQETRCLNETTGRTNQWRWLKRMDEEINDLLTDEGDDFVRTLYKTKQGWNTDERLVYKMSEMVYAQNNPYYTPLEKIDMALNAVQSSSFPIAEMVNPITTSIQRTENLFESASFLNELMVECVAQTNSIREEDENRQSMDAAKDAEKNARRSGRKQQRNSKPNKTEMVHQAVGGRKRFSLAEFTRRSN